MTTTGPGPRDDKDSLQKTTTEKEPAKGTESKDGVEKTTTGPGPRDDKDS